MLFSNFTFNYTNLGSLSASGTESYNNILDAEQPFFNTSYAMMSMYDPTEPEDRPIAVYTIKASLQPSLTKSKLHRLKLVTGHENTYVLSLELRLGKPIITYKLCGKNVSSAREVASRRLLHELGTTSNYSYSLQTAKDLLFSSFADTILVGLFSPNNLELVDANSDLVCYWLSSIL